MEEARAAIARFTSRKGHSTDVTETIRPAVTWETVKPHRHEIVSHAIDKEVHRHHYHTTVQPIEHREEVPAIHTHNLIPVEHREFRHHDEVETKGRVARDLARFIDSSITLPTTHSRSELPPVVGEHFHHHIHEVVQPIIYKEVIARETVHNTIPIHETHHNQSIHHHMSSLPLVTMDIFSSRGGLMNGNTTTVSERYEGAPRAYNTNLHTTMEKLGLATAGAAAVVGGAEKTSPVMGKKKHRRHHRDNSDSGVSGVSSSESDSDISASGRRQTHSYRV